MDIKGGPKAGRPRPRAG